VHFIVGIEYHLVVAGEQPFLVPIVITEVGGLFSLLLWYILSLFDSRWKQTQYWIEEWYRRMYMSIYMQALWPAGAEKRVGLLWWFEAMANDRNSEMGDLYQMHFPR